MTAFSIPSPRRRRCAAPPDRPTGRAAAQLLALVSALGVAACAVGTRSSGPSSTRDMITREELEELNADDVMEAVSILRPQWLRFRPMRTPGSPDPVVGVVVDGQPRGTRSDLAQIPIGTVERIEFMTSADATIRFGTGFTGGAIVVSTRRSPGSRSDSSEADGGPPPAPSGRSTGPVSSVPAAAVAQAHRLG